MPKTSTVFRLTPLSNTAEENYALIDRERTRLRLSSRYILCEDNYVVVKAMPSHLHERVTRAVEYDLKKVLQPYMPNGPGNEIRILGGSSNPPLFSVVTSVRTRSWKLPRGSRRGSLFSGNKIPVYRVGNRGFRYWEQNAWTSLPLSYKGDRRCMYPANLPAYLPSRSRSESRSM